MSQTSFQLTLSGMMEAMEEIQAKGDLMVKTIKDQKEVLNNLSAEIDKANQSLDQVKSLERKVIERRKDTMGKIVIIEKNTEKLIAQRAELELDLQMLEKSKVLKKETLENMEKEIEEMSNRKIEVDMTEKQLQNNRKELKKLQQKIDASTSLLR